MILSMWGQGTFFLSAILVGAIIGLLYDLFRVFRKIVKHGLVAVQIEDILFWLAAITIMFYFVFKQNDGEVRLFSLIGTFCGVLVYFFTISKWVKRILFTLATVMIRVIRTALGMLLFPIGFLIKLLAVPVKKAAGHSRKALAKGTRQLKILRKKV